MKRIVITLGVILAASSHNNAQNVGINPTGNLPNSSAGLDVDFTDKGILIPRVNLTNLTTYNPPIAAGTPTESILIYNINTAPGAPPKGYYYWDGAKWVKLLVTGNPSDAWLTMGNAGTNPANNFLGTTDNNDLVFKTNNTQRMRIKSNGQVVINNTTPFAGDVFSSYAAGTDAAINGYSSGSGKAVYGQNTGNGFSIVGLITNTNPAVYGQGPNIGTEGYATANNGTGLLGVGASTVTANGVTGIAGNNQAQGGVFINTNATGTGLIVGGNNVATMNYLTNGSAIAATSTTFGIVSYAKDAAQGNGIAAAGNNLGIISFGSGSGGTFNGQTIGVYGIASSSVNITWGGYFSNAGSGAGASYAYVGGKDPAGTNKKIEGNGTVSTIVKDLKGNLVTLTCPEAPEILFEDYGVGQLVSGRAHIDLDPIFAKNVTINEKHPLRVFIQLEGECNGVYVTNKTSAGFDVVELNGGKSNVKFVYHVVANRSDDIDENGNVVSRYADIRFGPGMPPMKPTFVESKTKEAQKITLPDITPKKVSSK